MKKIVLYKYVLLVTVVIAGLHFTDVSLAAGPCTKESIRWSGTSNRIYVSGDVECTLTEIKALGNLNIPLSLVDSANNIWFLGANLLLENGAKITMKGSDYSGDVNELRLKSNNSSATNSYVEIRADWGTIDINGVKITSWDEAVSGPDTEYSTYKRAFIRARSRLVSSVPKESRMDVRNSEIMYLGFNASESYGLVWKILGTGVFDTVGVYGDVEKNKIHHNYFGVYTYGAEAMNFLENEIYNNVKYGLDPHDDSDYLLIDKNNIHHNGSHGIICSQRCNNLTITNNESHNNIGNGIMLHRNANDSLIEYNNVHHNTDSGIALFDSHGNTVRYNTSEYNKNGLRTSVGSSENTVENNTLSNNAKYGMYFYKGSDAPTSGDGRPKLNTFKNNEINFNASEGIKLAQSDANTFESNDINSNGSYAVYIDNSNTNMFDNNITTANAKNHYYPKTNSVNNIKNTDSFAIKIGDTLSSMTITDSGNTIFSNSKGIKTDATATQSSILLDKILAGGSIVTFAALDFSVTPTSENILVKPITWNTSGDYYKKWTENNSISSTISNLHSVGSLAPNTSYNVLVNGSILDTLTSDENGRISFSYEDIFTSTKTFEVMLP